MLTVAIATETRAEYGLLRPIYRALDRRRGLRPVFIATGMHHLARFGRTIERIRSDRVRVREVRTLSERDGDDRAGRGRQAARAVAGYAAALADADWLVVLGDRMEMLAAVTAATAVGLPVAHLHGGDVAPGARDDSIRHAISKLAHLHFPATADAAARLRRLGEDPWRIRLAGAPAMDVLRAARLPGKRALDRLVGFDTGQPFALVCQHAAGFASADEQEHLLGTLAAVADHFARAVVIGPGLDPGGGQLSAAGRRFVAGRPGWRFFASLDQLEYFGLLGRCAVLAGNSSSGVIEAAWFRRPVVDVGPRQAGRERSSNVLSCGYGRPAVAAALKRALHDAPFARRLAQCRNLYGDGRAGETVAAALAATPIDRKLMVKRIAY